MGSVSSSCSSKFINVKFVNQSQTSKAPGNCGSIPLLKIHFGSFFWLIKNCEKDRVYWEKKFQIITGNETFKMEKQRERGK